MRWVVIELIGFDRGEVVSWWGEFCLVVLLLASTSTNFKKVLGFQSLRERHIRTKLKEFLEYSGEADMKTYLDLVNEGDT